MIYSQPGGRKSRMVEHYSKSWQLLNAPTFYHNFPPRPVGTYIAILLQPFWALFQRRSKQFLVHATAHEQLCANRIKAKSPSPIRNRDGPQSSVTMQSLCDRHARSHLTVHSRITEIRWPLEGHLGCCNHLCPGGGSGKSPEVAS